MMKKDRRDIFLSVFLLENILGLNDVQNFSVGFGWDSNVGGRMSRLFFLEIFQMLVDEFFGHFLHVSKESNISFVQYAKTMAERGANKEHVVNQNDAICGESAKSLFVMLFLVFYRFCLDFYPNMLYYNYI